MHDENGGNGDDNGDSVTSISDAGSATATPPLQISQTKQHGSVDGGLAAATDNNSAASLTTSSTTANAATNVNSTTATPTTSIPLGENTLLVDISDALSEKDKVKFTVHTRTTFPQYAKKDFFVVRQHEEFIWLHDRFEENEEYAGYIVSIPTAHAINTLYYKNVINSVCNQIPPCPPRPDFDASREKLQRLGEGEGNMTKEEFKKMKQELEAYVLI